MLRSEFYLYILVIGVLWSLHFASWWTSPILGSCLACMCLRASGIMRSLRSSRDVQSIEMIELKRKLAQQEQEAARKLDEHHDRLTETFLQERADIMREALTERSQLESSLESLQQDRDLLQKKVDILLQEVKNSPALPIITESVSLVSSDSWKNLPREQLVVELEKLQARQASVTHQHELQQFALTHRVEQLLVIAIEEKKQNARLREGWEREKRVLTEEHKQELERILTLAIVETEQLRKENAALKSL